MKLFRILILGAVLALSACDLNSPGPFDRKRMEDIVSQVRAQPFDGEKTFYWQEVSGAARLVADERQNRVFARRDAQRNLTVVILMHHGGRGEAGFAYSDVPFVRANPDEEAPPGGCSLDLPGYLHAAYPKRQIDAHWWPVWDNVG